MADAAERVVLAGQDAIDLWQQGADARNAWVAENPVAGVDFSGVDFTKYGGVSFAEFRFPNGKKDFSETVFGDGDISFRHTKFGEGNIVFFHANFSEGNVSFRGATLDAGNVQFWATAFGMGNIDFKYADLEKGSLIFNKVIFDKNDISINNANVNGNLQFQQCKKTELLSGLSFRAMRLIGTFDLEVDFTCVPDLRLTALAAHVDLQNLRIEASQHELNSPEDDKYAKGDPNIARLRRLKELAEQNRHHEAALHFFAMERRDARHTKAMSPGAAGLDYFYKLACDYGQSVLRPIIGLGQSVFLAALGYRLLAEGVNFGAATKAALVGAVPFLPLVRLNNNPLAALLGEGSNDALYFLAVGEQLFCFVFLFLLGVSLRNRFRL